MSGIIRKANELGRSATLVVGSPGGGKSTTVRDTILSSKADARVLWVAFNNHAALLGDPRTENWDTFVPSNWTEYDETIAAPAAANKFEGSYDVLVVDGLNVMAGMLLSKIAPGGQPSQPEWLQASNRLRDKFIAVREKFEQVYFIIDALPNKEGVREIDLNRHAANLLTPLFGARWYAYAVTDQKTGKLVYSVQKNPILAMAFQPNKE